MTLEERAEKAAKNARCDRCRTKILEDSSAAGLVYGQFRIPALQQSQQYQLCGKCGLGLREYLFPETELDREFQEIKQRLLMEFWS